MGVTPKSTGAQVRGALSFAFKLAVAAALLTWLVRSGSLDFGKLRVLFANKTLLASSIAVWLLSVGVVSSSRWRLLLRLSGVHLPFGRALMLQLTALFFNVVIPGNVGGDVIKSVYVAREYPNNNRASIFLVVFLERFLGMAGLAFMAGIAVLFSLPKLWPIPEARPLVGTIGLLCLGFLAGPPVFVLSVRAYGDKIRARLTGASRITRLLDQFLEAALLVSGRPAILFGALGMSMLSHGAAMAYFTLLTHPLTEQSASYAPIATVYPIGLLTLILPISPGGFGVGHMAFDGLFHMVGLTGGATVFNVFLISQLFPNLIGAVPYVLLRSRGELPNSDEN